MVVRVDLAYNFSLEVLLAYWFLSEVFLRALVEVVLDIGNSAGLIRVLEVDLSEC